jgi:uncharacterized repeat protein (TIGR01451 family)
MRFPLANALASLFLVFSANQAIAAIHFTDVQGGEVTIVRGTAPVHSRRVTTDGKPRVGTHAITTVNAGADSDAANNDYRRIQNALNGAASGDTIILTGVFDFTKPFASAAWAVGNDGVASTNDDYEVLVPAGKNNVTLTANSLGSATIQGPGDLAAINLEAFLVFDSSLSGPSTGWTISNLQIQDFDLSIGMFAAGASDYNNTTIANNFIRIPTDLNAVVAPADVNQNIGIHLSFGTNQTVSGNSIQIAGDGVSNGANLSSSVGLQSNTSGGAVYNGLLITNNTIHTVNAQSANPQSTLGIWENAHGHTSNITVSNNSFLNDAAGNDPALNIERAFRVTSHSGAASTVTYSGNTASGANIGFQWLTGSNFAGNQAVVMTNNTLTNCATGVLVQSNGIAHLETNVITGSGAGGGIHVVTGLLTASGLNALSAYRNFVTGGTGDGIWIEATAGAITDPMSQNNLGGNTGFGLRNESATSIAATLNYWGNDLAANVAAEVSGLATFDPWLASGTDVNVGTVGFQPFIYASTSGTDTTFVGTGLADVGSLLAGNPVTLSMDGDTATIPLAELLHFIIQLGGGDDVFTLGQTGILTQLDGSAGNDTLVGTNVAQTWNITGAGSGNIPGATSAFTNVEALRGGTAADSFVFGAAGSVAQTVDGNLGIDTLDNSAIPGHVVVPAGPGTLDGFKGTATGIGATFDNINLIAAPADLGVTKSGPATATVSTVINYLITVTNNGPNPAINATLTDALPAGVTFVSLASAGGWSCITPAVGANGTVTCTQGSMAVGSAPFTLSVTVPAAPATINNTAVVSTASADNTPGNNNSTASTNVVFTADVSVVKTATPTAPAGTNVTYGITVTNNGPTQASSVSMTDTLPLNTTFVSETQTTGPTFNCVNPSVGGAGTVTCTIASLVNGATATFTIVVNVSGAAPTGTLNNTANVSTTATDPTPGNNSSTAPTIITTAIADLSITKTAGPPPYTTGKPVTYTIVVSNAGPGAATNVVVTDTIPVGTTFNSATPTQGSCSGTSTVTCNLGTLANGASATISLTITLSANPGPVSNTASVTSNNPDPNPVNSAGTAIIQAALAFDIPAASPFALLLLGIALAIGGLFVQRLR